MCAIIESSRAITQSELVEKTKVVKRRVRIQNGR